MIKDKVQQRCKGGASELRYAFKHFDKDGSGDITYKEFEDALSMFNLKVSSADMGQLMRTYDPEGTGHINFVNFVNRMMPPDTFDITKQSALVSVRNSIEANFESLRYRMGRADSSNTGLVPLSDLLEACKSLGIALDDKMSSKRITGPLAHDAGPRRDVGAPDASGRSSTSRDLEQRLPGPGVRSFACLR